MRSGDVSWRWWDERHEVAEKEISNRGTPNWQNSRRASHRSNRCRRPLLQIVLMRHGKPKIDKNLWLNAAEFGAWVKKYNAAGIDIDYQPPQIAIQQANQCAFTVCSNLARSLESAKALGVERIGVCAPMFRVETCGVGIAKLQS